jgi:signal transduction histidine kinase
MMLRIRDYSITRKLTWMNMIVTASALLVAFAVFVAYELITCRQSMVRTLSIQAQIVGFNSISALAFNDPQSAERTLDALRAAPNIVSAGIYLPDGRPFAAYWRLQRKPLQPLPEIRKGQAEFHQFKAGRLLLVRPIVFRGAPAGIVLIRSDLRQIDSRVRQYGAVMIGVLVASLLAALWVSAAFQQAIAGPIVRLAETAQTVSREKDYSLRTPTAGSQGEVYVLIASFNEMLAQIQERDAALQKARDDLERRVDERTAQLQDANKELEAFSYSVSHDLRAPLRQVSGFAKILAEESSARLDAAGQRHLKWIQDGARHMGELVDDLLRLGRIGRQEMVEMPVDLNILLQDVLRDLHPEMQGRKIEWRIGMLPTIDCDAGLMKLTITNLLSNALKYTRRREVTVIEIAQIVQNGEIVVFIRDNGAGFDQKYAHKLFGIFQRLHHSDEFEGTGVGLATVQRIIQRHGGRIWAEGEVENGATFFFTVRASSQRADRGEIM